VFSSFWNRLAYLPHHKEIISSIIASSSLGSGDIPDAFSSSETFFLKRLSRSRYLSRTERCVTRKTGSLDLPKVTSKISPNFTPLDGAFFVLLRLKLKNLFEEEYVVSLRKEYNPYEIDGNWDIPDLNLLPALCKAAFSQGNQFLNKSKVPPPNKLGCQNLAWGWGEGSCPIN